jgi:hypothetical protein
MHLIQTNNPIVDTLLVIAACIFCAVAVAVLYRTNAPLGNLSCPTCPPLNDVYTNLGDGQAVMQCTAAKRIEIDEVLTPESLRDEALPIKHMQTSEPDYHTIHTPSGVHRISNPDAPRRLTGIR